MKIKSFIVLLFLGCCIHAQFNYDSIKGNVKSVREKLIFLNDSIQNRKLLSIEGDYGHDGFISSKGTISKFYDWWYHTYWVHYVNYVKKYNNKGQLISENWFDKKDSLIRKYNYQYDKRGNQIQIIEMNGKLDQYTTINNFHYNERNQLQSKLRMSLAFPEYYTYTLYYYDENKKLVEIENFDERGKSYGSKYEYDSAGRKIKDIQHSPYVWIQEGFSSTSVRDNTGTDYLHREYFYDENSNLIREKRYVQDDYDRNKYKPSSTIVYSYGSQNRKTKYCHIDAYYPVGNCILYEYDKNNLLVEEYRTHSGQKQKYKYADGKLFNLIYEEYVKEKLSKTEVNFSYEFDSQGNWVKQTKIVNGKSLYVRVRDIEYFSQTP